MAKYKSTGLTGKKLVINKHNSDKGKGNSKAKNPTDIMDSSEFASEEEIADLLGKGLIQIVSDNAT